MFGQLKTYSCFRKLFANWKNVHIFIYLRSFEIVRFKNFAHQFPKMFLFSRFSKYVHVFKFGLGISKNVPITKKHVHDFGKYFTFKILFCSRFIFKSELQNIFTFPEIWNTKKCAILKLLAIFKKYFWKCFPISTAVYSYRFLHLHFQVVVYGVVANGSWFV